LRRHRPACAHGAAALLGLRGLGRDRRAQVARADDPRARQRRHLGGDGRAAHAARHRLRRGTCAKCAPSSTSMHAS
jgi:hypothetical protein